jgi:hypothetical protein
VVAEGEELVVEETKELRVELEAGLEMSVAIELLALPALNFVLSFTFVLKLAEVGLDRELSSTGFCIGGLDMTLNEGWGVRCLIGIGAILSMSFSEFMALGTSNFGVLASPLSADLFHSGSP